MLWRQRAEVGDAAAQTVLGLVYVHGKGVPQDDVEAVTWLGLAAEHGDPMVHTHLATVCAPGRGVAGNAMEAVRWWRAAAEQGEADAQSCLGSAFYNGEGVEQDLAERVRWWRKAAEPGQPDAQCGLEVAYFGGNGTPHDHVQAYACLSLAAVQGDEKAADVHSPALVPCLPRVAPAAPSWGAAGGSARRPSRGGPRWSAPAVGPAHRGQRASCRFSFVPLYGKGTASCFP